MSDNPLTVGDLREMLSVLPGLPDSAEVRIIGSDLNSGGEVHITLSDAVLITGTPQDGAAVVLRQTSKVTSPPKRLTWLEWAALQPEPT